ncbi:MAG: sensor histidine kinase [Nocardioides sp.]
MRRQIGWLTAATTSAVVLAFVIPLCLLVRTLAEDRALANADQEARNVAILVSGLHSDPRLARLVRRVDERSPEARTSLLMSDGRVLGTANPQLATDPEVVRAAQGEAFTTVDAAGARILIPVLTEAGTLVIRTSVAADDLHRGVARAWAGIISLGAALLVAALVVAVRLAGRISTPVTDLATVAHRLREGDLDARAEPSGPPETVELGVALNRLAERVVELLAAERAAVGDLAHRLRTPVTALRLDVESVRDPAVTARLQEHIAQLQRTFDAIVKDARRPVRTAMTSTCDAARVVRERVTFWSALAEDQDRALHLEIPGISLQVAVDEADLRDVLDIVVDNVFAHTPDGVPLAIRLEVDGPVAVLTVRDEGPGFDEHHGADRAGERIGSTGLGLQILRRAVAGFGGDVEVRSAPGQGTEVRLRLPRDVAGSGAG